METFENTLDRQRFESTNALWNSLCLNDPWSVGYVSRLVESKIFCQKEDWESFYYASGAERKNLLMNLPAEIVALLNDFELKRTNPGAIPSLRQEWKTLNYNYGRTPGDLQQKALVLYRAASAEAIDITENECVESVRFRTICQTWNGVIVREKKAADYLRQLFPGCDFIKTEGAFDYHYAVDFQVFIKGKMIAGLQIKPISYLKSKAPYVQTARTANLRKHRDFIARFGAPVFELVFENGAIQNPAQLVELKTLIFKMS